MKPQTKELMRLKMESRLAVKPNAIIATLFSVALTLVAGCSKAETKAAAAPSASIVPVVIATALQKDVPVSLRSIGNVQAYQAVSIKSQINSQINEVHFTQGQDVQSGDLLFVLDRRQLEADLRRAENSLLR